VIEFPGHRPGKGFEPAGRGVLRLGTTETAAAGAAGGSRRLRAAREQHISKAN
jgi:hypothetical protein